MYCYIQTVLQLCKELEVMELQCGRKKLFNAKIFFDENGPATTRKTCVYQCLNIFIKKHKYKLVHGNVRKEICLFCISLYPQ